MYQCKILGMIELTRSQHVFELNLLKQKLEAADIPCVILDEHTGGLMQGIGNIYPRLMVLDEDLEAARNVMADLKTDL